MIWLVATYFCSFGLYAYLAKWLPMVTPGMYAVPAVILAGILLACSKELRLAFRSHPGMAWLGFFMTVSLGWFVAFPQSEPSTEAFKHHLTMAMVFAATLTACLVPGVLRSARAVMAWGVVFGCLMNIWELFYPSPYNDYGFRSAGLYTNPNDSANALVFGLLLTFGIVPKRLRTVCLILVLTGVTLTFSRSGMLMLLLVLGWFSWMGLVSWKHLLLSVSACLGVMFILLLLFRLTDFQAVQSRFLQNGFVERMSLKVLDYSGLDRIDIVRQGWEYMSQAPWFGHGLGSSEAWVLGYGAHNEFLMLMMDFGFWGVVIYPWLIMSLVPSNRLGVLAVLFMVILGCFDHNLFDTLGISVCFGVLGAIRLVGPPEQGGGGPQSQGGQASPSALSSPLKE